MNGDLLPTLIHFAYVLAAALFVVGLHQMNSPVTARQGNLISAAGMLIAVVVTGIQLVVLGSPATGATAGLAWPIIIVGTLIGGGLGFLSARRVKMTAMPQLVSIFNAVGGGAAGLIAIEDYMTAVSLGHATVSLSIFVVAGSILGSVAFSGSIIATGKLQGFISGSPIMFPGHRLITAALALIAVGGTAALVLGAAGAINIAGLEIAILAAVVVATLVFGVTMVMPIGGADMPVVISLLNSGTGLAAAFAGLVLNNPVLIIAGALVGASGAILTKLMADAMNRSVMNVMLGGFGGGEAAGGTAAEGGATGNVREVGVDDAAIQLAYAQKVIIVPGYGLAVAQAQHAVRELAELLEARGIEVSYAIHPVAGRMPGHMNVLLAEANVPYPQLKEMEEINPEFSRTDVALVIGANDVTNPAARSNPQSPIYGMPILDVDSARSIIVMKRSMRPGYAGIDNELYLDPKTGMLFADAREGLSSLIGAVKQL
ncbi:MAG TPA: NAD(P)(+) transhydrogenase (Re/Si-specific) subunit beta [Candidatus Limnocylindria bacterium]|jgi:H+-translocating NAD(P) transhydrogenase subunit beta|nr:NAD(P)(+) transhydrogenase (Re/Si-specific) subunit beta [Candidatus Limnocylindria bacterium]